MISISKSIEEKYLIGILRPSTLDVIQRKPAVKIDEHFIPHDVLTMMKALERYGVPAPVLHGGAIREYFFQHFYGSTAQPNDLDIKAPLDRSKFFNESTLLNFAQTLQEIRLEAKKIEITRDVIIIKFAGSIDVDLVMADGFWPALGVAASGGVSVCSAAATPNGQVYVDANFVADARDGVFRPYRIKGQDNQAIMSKLNFKYNNHFSKYISPDA